MTERIGTWEPPKKLIPVLMGALLVYVLARNLVAAAGKPFWYDEILTWTISSLGSWGEIMKALRLPLDGQPPLFDVIEHYASGLARNKEVVLRLPSIVAFPCALACVFVYVRKRGGERVALLCAIMLLMTQVYQQYATEARPYSILVACIAFALVCYDRVPSATWTLLLALSLALAESIHYMAVIAMIPFGLAEAVYSLRARRFRWQVWVALGAGVVPLVVFWPLLAVNKSYFGVHFWAHFEFAAIPSAYGELFLTGSPFGAAIMAVALIGMLAIVTAMRSASGDDSDRNAKDLADATVVLGLAALPFIGYVAVVLLQHSALTTRYVLSTATGICIAFGYILSRAKRGAVELAAVFVLAVVGMHEVHFWRSSRNDIREVHSMGIAAEKFIATAGHAELPVVVPPILTFVQLIHYASSPAAAERYVCLTRIPRAGGGISPDMADLSLDIVKLYIPMRTYDFASFAEANRNFLLYAVEKDPGRDKLILYLSHAGWTLQTVALDDWQRVYLVTRPNSFVAVDGMQKQGQESGHMNVD
jgi:hypothetical protein